MRLLVTSDTHLDSPEDIPETFVGAVEEAEAVMHAGDFSSRPILRWLDERTTLHAVHGNAYSAEVHEAVPRRKTFEADGARVCVVHGHDTANVAYEAAETGADIVVRGHTHTPSYKERAVPVLNPGSLTCPRGSPPSYAWLTCEDGRYGGRIVTLDGKILVGFGEEL
jgi:hypothetical protein